MLFRVSSVTDSRRASPFDRPSAGVRDAVALDLDRRTDGLGRHRCVPGEHKLRQHLMPESIGEQRRVADTVSPGVGEYFERASLFCAEVLFRHRRCTAISFFAGCLNSFAAISMASRSSTASISATHSRLAARACR